MDIEKLLKQKNPLPVYFLYGEDIYQSEKNLELLEEYLAPGVDRGADWRVFHRENDFGEVWLFLTAYPFFSDKKVAILKECEQRNAKDIEMITKYVNVPTESSVLVILYDGKIASSHQKLLKLCSKLGSDVESKALKNRGLEEWISRYAAQQGKVITNDGAQILIDQSGNDRAILEMQINKILLFAGENTQITKDIILSQNVKTKSYAMWDIENALIKRNAKEAFKIVFRLLENGDSPLVLIAYLNNVFLKIARIDELLKDNKPSAEIAKTADIFEWKLDSYRALAKQFPAPKRKRIAYMLLDSDLALKTSRFDHKTIMSNLLIEIFS